MAKITDPDSIQLTTDVIFDTSNRTIEVLSTGAITSTEGISLQALYSFCKDRWKDNTTLIKYPFPLEAITPEQFEFKNGWIPKDQSSINLLKDGGFAIKDLDGASAAEYIGCITLGSIGTGGQPYYQRTESGAAENVVLSGAVNQCIPYSYDNTNDRAATLTSYLGGSNFDYSAYFKIFIREYQKVYAQSSQDDIGVSDFTYQAYRFPLANADDLKITHTDGAVQAGTYTGITITYYGTNQTRTIGTEGCTFTKIINGNNRSAEEIYEKVQYLLRQSSDIDSGSGTVVGKTADTLLTFVGDTLVTARGVYIDNFQTADTNRLNFYDTNGDKKIFPFVAAGTIVFNDNLVTDGNAIYKMYYTNSFGTTNATLVKDASDAYIEGTITTASINFTYDYENDTDGGLTANVNKEVTLVAIGKTKAQYIVASGTIYKTTANSIALAAALERNYAS